MRIIVRIALLLATTISISAIVMSLLLLGPSRNETWVTIAGALAVITSVISSWPAQRVLELQQDAQLPYPYPSIDIKSRLDLMQLRITNYGGSVAHNVNIIWDKPLLNDKEEQVRFTKQIGAPEIPVLLPNESVAVLIGASHTLYKKFDDMNYSGKIEFSNASGKKQEHPFFLSAETYRSTLNYDEEEPKTHRQLQKIPDELQKLRNELNQIRNLILSNSDNLQ